MPDYVLNVELRSEKGKNACHRLRERGYIPAVLCSRDISEVIKVQKKEFFNLFKGHISESVLIDINILDKEGDSSHKVFVKDYQVDVVTDEVLHLDFYKIKMGEKIHTMVPIEIIGTSPGVKMGGILEVVLRELEIECLPMELPENIQIDVTNLQIGDSIHIEDLPTSGSFEFLGAPQRVVVSVLSPKKVEVEEEKVAEAEEEAVVEEGKKEPEQTKEEATKEEK